MALATEGRASCGLDDAWELNDAALDAAREAAATEDAAAEDAEDSDLK